MANLPTDLWFLIFQKLPLKSVIKCRTVKKAWYTILSTHSFAIQYQTYRHNHYETKKVVIADRTCDEMSDTVYTDVDGHLQPVFPVFRPTSEAKQVSSCDGLLLLLKETWYRESGRAIFNQRLILWNPSIDTSKNLPPTLFTKNLTFIFGVGMDLRHNVKVMRIGFSKPSWVPSVSEIFDLKTGLWRTIKVWVPLCEFDTIYSPHLVHGSLHWIAYGKTVMDNGLFHRSLVSFDMRDEAFKDLQIPQMNYPRRGGGDIAEEATLLLFGGDKLAMAQFTLHRAGHEAAYMDQLLCVWVMSEYGVEASWKLMVKLDMSDGNIGRPFYVSMNGDLIVWADGEVSFCDYNNNIIGLLSKYTFNPQFFVYPYRESLLLLK